MSDNASKKTVVKELVDPKVDIVFKKIFSDELILISFLNSVLSLPDSEKITSVTLVDTSLPGDFPEDKSPVVDLKVKDRSGKTFHVEIQYRYHKAFAERVTYYWSKLYSRQMKRGGAYTELKKVVSIIIVNFTMFKQTPNYHSCFQLADRTQDLLLTDVAEIHILELIKLPKQAAEIIPEPGEQWLHFINRGHKMEQSVFERWNTPEIKKAYKELQRMSMDPEFRDLYERQHKMLNDYFWGLESEYLRGTEEGLTKGLEEGLTKGLEEGLKQGQKEKAIEIALNLIDVLDIKTIANKTGLREDEISAIKKNRPR